MNGELKDGVLRYAGQSDQNLTTRTLGYLDGICLFDSPDTGSRRKITQILVFSICRSAATRSSMRLEGDTITMESRAWSSVDGHHILVEFGGCRPLRSNSMKLFKFHNPDVLGQVDRSSKAQLVCLISDDSGVGLSSGLLLESLVAHQSHAGREVIQGLL